MNRFWGRRYGGFYSARKTKGSAVEDGWVIRVRRGGPTTNSSAAKPKHYTAMLAINAISVGWCNGIRR